MSEAKRVECEGACEYRDGHSGQARKYRITGPDGYCWGEYWYCDAAAEHDRNNGLSVTEMAPDDHEEKA